ncbi:MAG: serine/threonine-protein kinase [Polyangiaceae bacterium]
MAGDPFGLVGSTLDNRHRIDGVVGEGGFGVVYRGWHLAFGHAIAVKCLKVDTRFDEAQRALFLRKFREEATFLSRLSQHPAIVRVFDLNVTNSPRVPEVPYLVLEWLDGVELERSLAERSAKGIPPLGERDALAMLRPVIDAIALAHSLRIAHRDLKPANLFHTRVASGSILKVLDFGIAKSMNEGEIEAALSTRTSSGFSAFSPPYGAPEQFRSKRFGATGPWTDVHALGLILSEVLSGRTPYQGSELFDYFEASAAPDRPTPRRLGARVSDALEAVCAKALALEPRDRFPDARALLSALDAVANSPAVTGPPLPSHVPSLQIPSEQASASLATDAYLAARGASFGVQARGAEASGGHAAPLAQGATVQAGPAPAMTAPPAPKKRRSKAIVALGILVGMAVIGGGITAAIVLQTGAPPPKKKKKPPPTSQPVASITPSPAPLPVEDTSLEGLRLYRDRSNPDNRGRGIELMKRACDAGFGLGCTGVAWATMYGEGVPKDELAAQGVLEVQCAAGVQLACAILGDAFLSGVGGIAKNEKKGLDLVDHACKGGNLLGCAFLGGAYDRGKAVLKDEKRADELYAQACDGGELRGCWMLSMNTSNGEGVPKDENRAAQLALKACNGGAETGCFLLGLAYLRGRGVPKDPKRTSELYQQACDGGVGLACSNLAVLYANGIGVPKDLGRAVAILQKSCDDGDGLGCNDLGILYLQGKGVPKDEKRSAELLDKACTLGEMDACMMLGTQYALGQSVPKDEKKATELYDRACTAGKADGCAQLGFAYVHGSGVPTDRSKGIDLLKKGCNDGSKWGCEQLRALGE